MNSNKFFQWIHSFKTLSSNSTIYLYFWIFGLINNILYVVILSAAIDIVETNIPKSLVLLVDILPSLTIKLLSPFFIQRIKYGNRIILLIILSCVGMILVSLKDLWICLFGVGLASLSSGFGEVTFLQLTHTYKEVSLNGWSSGTGGAGLLGSAIYLLLTTVLHIPIRISLLLFSILPFGFLLYYRLDGNVEYHPLQDHQITTIDIEESQLEPELGVFVGDHSNEDSISSHISKTLAKLKMLIMPYMLPLTTVYFFEYLINQAVSPTLLFPIADPDEILNSHFSFFHKYRDFYVTYGTLYQMGVFISRSTAHVFRIKQLYLLSALQAINLLIVLLQSWNYIVHRPWPIMILIVYEGLLGGSSYVNTFLNVLSNVPPQDKEFALGSVSIADSLGILLAALVGTKLEPTLCQHQVSDNRPWCTLE
ncbi:similar to Saccharomyces cerevisiae YJL059W YHC3 Vacuolar membrane protein involved in the ATP-dependent transport of arginine into the vacuole and possibly in balancing ion homeostasis [Maudiozyma saulgeensis]|uniref:Protein BTN n=1 Tax=Maudiozyma saulgeensis TaxID=1789683 RepID=A0A1X7R819_9SACH|nr:similar to Saccharomyces cerevisiae YJL059W YHC3 Vacuolar membrane protein involved in the ATP-dependent transport of arginine into the vacuole and possibly in balancing ion homeostasis [Kazachstania saulgeensis]